MKKFHLLLTLCATLSAAASTPTKVFDQRCGIFVIPSYFLLPDNNVVVFLEEEDYSISSLKIYDGDLNLKTTINIPAPVEEPLEVWYQYRESDSGEWGEKNSYTDFREREYFDYIYHYVDCLDSDGVPVTQTFFNNDDKFEYIAPKYEIVDYEIEYDYENWAERRGGQKLLTTGYEVKSQDGSTLFSIDIPEEYLDKESPYNDNSIALMPFAGKNYVVIYTGKAQLIYTIDGINSLKAPTIVNQRMSVSPNVARHGEKVTVDLGAEAAGNCTLTLTSVNGHTIMTEKIAAGTTSTTLSTGSLSQGTYIVTVNNGSKSHEAAKIIVR